MNSVISTHAKLASLRLAMGLVRAAAVASALATVGLGSIGPSALGWLGGSGLAIAVATPAQARCLIGGDMRQDIADSDCLEAQRTGCVRRMLTPEQYKNCLQANKEAREGGQACIIGGRVRNDLSALDCEEAKATGCVRRLLTPAQYRACLDAQPPVR
jgi:hypothetical protein